MSSGLWYGALHQVSVTVAMSHRSPPQLILSQHLCLSLHLLPHHPRVGLSAAGSEVLGVSSLLLFVTSVSTASVCWIVLVPHLWQYVWLHVPLLYRDRPERVEEGQKPGKN